MKFINSDWHFGKRLQRYSDRTNKCVGERCFCFNFCTHGGEVLRTFCDAVLSTKFFSHFADTTPKSYQYRDPMRKDGASSIANRKKKRK